MKYDKRERIVKVELYNFNHVLYKDSKVIIYLDYTNEVDSALCEDYKFPDFEVIGEFNKDINNMVYRRVYRKNKTTSISETYEKYYRYYTYYKKRKARKKNKDKVSIKINKEKITNYDTSVLVANRIRPIILKLIKKG